MDLTTHALLREIRDLLRPNAAAVGPIEQAARDEIERLKSEALIEGSRSAIAAHWAEKGLRRGLALAAKEPLT